MCCGNQNKMDDTKTHTVTIPDKCLLHKVGKVVFHLFGGIGGGVETDYEDK